MERVVIGAAQVGERDELLEGEEGENACWGEYTLTARSESRSEHERDVLRGGDRSRTKEGMETERNGDGK